MKKTASALLSGALLVNTWTGVPVFAAENESASILMKDPAIFTQDAVEIAYVFKPVQEMMNASDYIVEVVPAGEQGTVVTLPSLETEGTEEEQAQKAQLEGWIIDEQIYLPGDTVTLEKDSTAFAIWKNRAVVYHEVYLEDENGNYVLDSVSEEYVLPAQVTAENPDVQPVVIQAKPEEKEGYVLNTELSNASVTVDTIKAYTIRSIYGRQICTMKFDLNLEDSRYSMEDLQVPWQTGINITDPQLDGYELEAWEIDGELVEPGEVYILTKDVTAKAIWKEKAPVGEPEPDNPNVPEPTPTPDPEPEEPSNPQNPAQDEVKKAPYIQEVYLEDTDGSYVQSSSIKGEAEVGSNKSMGIQEIENYTLNQDRSVLTGKVGEYGLTLKAFYDLKNITITWSLGGGKFGSTVTLPSEFKAGDQLEMDMVPTRSGYTFNYWTIGNTKVNKGDIITLTSDVTIKAVWKKNVNTPTNPTNAASGTSTTSGTARTTASTARTAASSTRAASTAASSAAGLYTLLLGGSLAGILKGWKKKEK